MFNSAFEMNGKIFKKKSKDPMQFVVVMETKTPKIFAWCKNEDDAKKQLKKAESQYPHEEFDYWPVSCKSDLELAHNANLIMKMFD